jgi:hypothetical protein
MAHVQDPQEMDAAKICTLLPEHQQKWLALEISRCHLEDLGKPLAEEADACSHKGLMDSSNYSNLERCLRNLTDAGANAYTHYVSYVQQLCIRLTQEVLLHQQQVAQSEISSQYASISSQSLEQIETLQKVAQSHADQMKTLSGIPNQVKKELQKELAESLQKSLQDSLEKELGQQLERQLDGQLSRLLQEQAVEQVSFMTNLMQNLEHRDQDHQERYELWTHYQTSLWQTQAKEVEKQSRKMLEQRIQMEHLAETVSRATNSMQPLVGLRHIFSNLNEGYAWAVIVLHFVVAWNIVWLMSRSSRCDRFRSYLFGLVLFEAANEVGLMMLERYQILDGDERVLAVTQLRVLAYSLECGVYVGGMVWSLIPFTKATESSASDVASISLATQLDELKRQHEEVLQRMEAREGTSFASNFSPPASYRQQPTPILVSPPPPQHYYHQDDSRHYGQRFSPGFNMPPQPMARQTEVAPATSVLVDLPVTGYQNDSLAQPTPLNGEHGPPQWIGASYGDRMASGYYPPPAPPPPPSFPATPSQVQQEDITLPPPDPTPMQEESSSLFHNCDPNPKRSATDSLEAEPSPKKHRLEGAPGKT